MQPIVGPSRQKRNTSAVTPAPRNQPGTDGRSSFLGGGVVRGRSQQLGTLAVARGLTRSGPTRNKRGVSQSA